jgi:hypothetical protein
MVRRACLVIVASAAAATAGAQPAAGPEFQVNSFTPSYQYEPKVAADGSGNFVVVWTSIFQDGSVHGVFGQRYDRSGNPLGGEFAVNTITTAYQGVPSVAMHSSGSFVVAWASGVFYGDFFEIMARRFDGAGNALGEEFTVNTVVTGYQFAPDVAVAPSGDFVVAWQSYGQDGDDSGIFARRFNSAGGPLTGEFAVNAYTSGAQLRPTVAMNPLGQAGVAWVSDMQDGSGYGIFARAFSAAGLALGQEFRVNRTTDGDQDWPDVGMDSLGRFVVVWESLDQDGDDDGVFGQRFGALTNPLGSEFRVNAFTTGPQEHPSVAVEADGHFVVTWNSLDQSGMSADDVYGQTFDPAGARIGSEFRVNAYTTGGQTEAKVASLAPAEFVVVWTDSGGRDGDEEGVFAQRFADFIFADGFNR